jgi:hypothetical protein
MATNFANEIVQGSLATRHARLSLEHRFFIAVAVAFPLITVIGFAPSYYLRPLFDRPPVPSVVVHIHGALMTAWILLYGVQTWLVTSKRLKLHITLGLSSIGLAAAMVVFGTWVGYAAFVKGASFPGFTPGEFFIVPLGDIVTFALLYGAAIFYRKRSADHKRLMLTTVLNFLAPSIGRLPFEFAINPLWFIGVPDLIGIILVAGDTYRNKKLNKAFAAGVGLMIASHWLRLVFARTDAWHQFTNWLIS